MPYLVAILLYLTQNYSYHIRGDRSPLRYDHRYIFFIYRDDISMIFGLEFTLKHTTTIFSLSDHYILSREWGVIVNLVQTNYHGKPTVL